MIFTRKNDAVYLKPNRVRPVMPEWGLPTVSSVASGGCCNDSRALLWWWLFMLGLQQGPPSADMGTMTKLLFLTSTANPYTMRQV